MMLQLTQERFLKDVTNHKLEVLLDNGVYRHLKFSNNGSSCYRFDLITFPGHLLITGDMGDLLFERVQDMFPFFRGDGINPRYWEEKLQASDGDVTEIDVEAFTQYVNEDVESYIEGMDDEDADELKSDVQWKILDMVDDSTPIHEAYRLVSEYNDHGFSFTDYHDWNFKQYTVHYLWKLYAIVWGIQQYDLHIAEVSK